MPADFDATARRVLEARYLLRDRSGAIEEDPEGMFRRVARTVASAERGFAPERDARIQEETFFEVLSGTEFLPNSPTLMNAGTPLGQLSACFVLPVEDSMEGIFDTLRVMALVQQSGGGTGFAFSRLRPRGDIVRSTGGEASGPVSFARIFDCATENIRQGGRRRGANMGVLRVDHPDIGEFVDAKLDGSSFANFNLSVGVTDDFMAAAGRDRAFSLRHPRNGQVVAEIPAAGLFRRIAAAAWKTGDPGLLFLDAINRSNPTPALGAIEATNPCGEVPLLPWEACNLGSLNLSRLVRRDGKTAGIDWDRLARVVRIAIRFLDDVIEVNRWPDPRIAAAVRGNRKVGLGVMGFAEMLILMGIPYGSARAARVAGELMAFIAAEARAASCELARERGVFPNWKGSVHEKAGIQLRNATCVSIAPTGTLGIIAGTSAGIEPLFALAYRRRALDGETFTVVSPVFRRYLREQGLSEAEFLERANRDEGLGASGKKVREVLRTALEIEPDDHLGIQAAFQQHVDNAVSKTINLPADATAANIEHIYRRAWDLGLKGITVYRYGSKSGQVLELESAESPEEREHFARCDPGACRL